MHKQKGILAGWAWRLALIKADTALCAPFGCLFVNLKVEIKANEMLARSSLGVLGGWA